MGGIAISPNLRRESERIDVNGNVIDPATKQVLKLADADAYAPTNEEREAAMAKVPPTPEEIAEARREIKAGVVEVPRPPGGLNIEDIISRKIEALVEKKVNEVLEKLLK